MTNVLIPHLDHIAQNTRTLPSWYYADLPLNRESRLSNTSTDNNAPLNFDDFCELLLPYGALNSPAELHGTFCGKLCGGAKLDQPQWRDTADKTLELAGQANIELWQHIDNLFTSTQAQLESGDYNLELLLPDDDADLEQQTQALAQWCNGFLLGFGSAGIDPNSQFSSENAEALRDLAAIVQAETDAELDEDEQAGDFIELVEYVRIVALNFFEEYRSIDEKSETLH